MSNNYDNSNKNCKHLFLLISNILLTLALDDIVKGLYFDLH